MPEFLPAGSQPVRRGEKPKDRLAEREQLVEDQTQQVQLLFLGMVPQGTKPVATLKALTENLYMLASERLDSTE